MNIAEKIGLMKHEIRLANRTTGDGLKNWTPEARAKSLAVRRAKGSVWGWDKRPRGSADSLSPGFDRTMEEIEKDAPRVRRIMELHASGIPTIGPRDKYADELAAQQLEAFKAWLAEVKRVEGAIDDFNGTVAALGGLTGGMAKAQRGQRIEPVKTDAAAEAAAKKVAVEKSIRRNFEKRNSDYLRKNPEDRAVMQDMVAEKAEYYSAQPARKVEMEKAAYRRFKDETISSMREVADYGAEFKTKLEAKRRFLREREEVRKSLKDGESAVQHEEGVWVGIDAAGKERLIYPKTGKEPSQKYVPNNDLLDAILEARLGSRLGSGLIVNRHTSACAKSKSEKCGCSCGGAQHGTQSPGDDTAEPSKTGEPKEGKEPAPPETDPEESDTFDALVTYYKKAIELGEKPNVAEMRQGYADNLEKFKVAYAALAEAWHTYSLDKFQDQFEREPKRNFEFRTFQKKIGVPPEFIGGK